MKALVSPTPSKTPFAAPPSLKDPAEGQDETSKDSIKRDGIGTEMLTSPPVEPSEKGMKPKKEKVVHTKGFFTFIASPAPTKAHLSVGNNTSLNRSNLDIARDRKPILEISDQKTDSTETEKSTDSSPTDEKATDDPIEKDKNVQKKEKDKEKKKKKKKKDEKTERNVTETVNKSNSKSYIESQETNQETTKARIKPSQDPVISPSNSVSNPQDANEDEGASEETKIPSASKEGKKKTKMKKNKKKEAVTRDKAGRIVRKHKKKKGRGRVVQPDCFRKGKDAKIGLATINEDFYAGLQASDSEDDDSISCDEIWCTDPSLRTPLNSSHDRSNFDLQEGSKNINSSEREKWKSKIELAERAYAKWKKDESTDNIVSWMFSKKTNKFSSSNEAPLTTGQNIFFPPTNTSSDVLALTNTTILTQESISNTGVNPTAVSTDSSEDTDSPSEESVDSTCCTSMASSQNENDGEDRSKCFCFRSKWRVICTALLFVVAVAAGTVGVGYFFFFRDNFDEEDEVGVAANTAPSMEPRPNLRPTPKPTLTPPASILTTLSTSCYMPDEVPGTIILQAEEAPVINFAPIQSTNSGYCGDGYASLLPKPRAGFKFWSLEVESHGYYSVAIRYNNVDEGKISLGLIINDLDKATFDLQHTENESSWMVLIINNVLLHEGENSIRISVLDSEQDKGPNVDWLALVLQKPLSKFDYLSSQVAQLTGISAQTLLQTHTIQWMANEDTIDYSEVTDIEIIERYALLHVYHSTAGDMWANKSQWLSESHICSWYGISCSADMLVTDLTLDKNELLGFIPTDLSLLTNLVALSLDNNRLQGTIPPQIGRLTNLSKLDLHSNFLSGTIPSELGSLKEIQKIDLRTNSLNGKIPEECFFLDSLETVALGSNFLTGTLSTSVGQLESLVDLDLQIGQLSGTIPSELGNLLLLTNLSLGYNRFTGQIPGELGLLQNLSLLDINSNRLTGILPAELSLLEDTVIDYYGNNIVA